jgi:hypothetical protein
MVGPIIGVQKYEGLENIIVKCGGFLFLGREILTAKTLESSIEILRPVRGECQKDFQPYVSAMIQAFAPAM